MTIFTINSRKHGEQTFTVNTFGGYVRLNDRQICDGGKFTGSTISIHLTKAQKDDVCYSISDQLESIAKKWWKSYLKHQREYN